MCANGQGEIEKLPSFINSPLYDESSPVISKDGRNLFFTRTADPEFESTLINSDGVITTKDDEQYMQQLAAIYSQIAGEEVVSPTSSVLNQDIWIAAIHDDTLMMPSHPGYPLNNALPNSLVSTGIGNNEYVLLNEFYEDGSMYNGFSRATIEADGSHTFPRPMYIYGFNIEGSDVNMTMSPFGHVLIMSMKGPESRSHKDFYVSYIIRDNVWSTPVHMGQMINSKANETTPYISPDKRFLYFSSDRGEGIGGYDIYVAERLDYTWTNWSAPIRMNTEVNSTSDDSHPYFDPARNYLYFTSRRDGTSDIFRQRLSARPQLSKPIVVRGKIVNKQTGKLARAELFWGQLSAKDYLEYFNSYSGEFMVTLTEYEPYKFQLRKSNHSAQRILIDPRGVEKNGKDTVDMIFYIEPDDAAEPIVISSIVPSSFTEESTGELEETSSFYDIYFIKSKSDILQKSLKALDILTTKLLERPSMEIMIIGHTDDVGDESALFDLSVKRAEAVKQFLVRQGVSSSRIQTSGVGASAPMYDNSSEANRERNRRVEIKIIKS
jgi:outer membrane protein OmpA-like peptidoglycan-associated protein